jgi:hypothetical protein
MGNQRGRSCRGSNEVWDVRSSARWNAHEAFWFNVAVESFICARFMACRHPETSQVNAVSPQKFRSSSIRPVRAVLAAFIARLLGRHFSSNAPAICQ